MLFNEKLWKLQKRMQKRSCGVHEKKLNNFVNRRKLLPVPMTALEIIKSLFLYLETAFISHWRFVLICSILIRTYNDDNKIGFIYKA